MYTNKIYVSSTIDADIERVWQIIRDFNGMPLWHPLIQDSRIENDYPSDKIGCVRNFRTQGGDRIREQLLAQSDYDFSFTYGILESGMEVTDYIASVRLLPITDGNRCFLEWTAEFACAPDKKQELCQFIAQNVFQAGINALKKKLQP
ncbi:MAG: SRPBCC family protein [Gammaproteobacteria bacterium]|nr:SRPBCC family protein [Gammaproteobacteria bacterium]